MRRLLLPLLLLVTTASAAERTSFSYIYKHGDQSHMRSSGAGIESMVRKSKQWSGEYVGSRQWAVRRRRVS